MITLWHNPRCSKSRQALALLEDSGTQVSIRKYLEDTPSAAEIDAAQLALGNKPLIDMTRTGEKLFKEMGLSKSSSDGELRDAMLEHPILIERPIAFHDNRAIIGRPPENVLSLL